MKALLLIRHAKSSWAIAGQEDFDRPLNDRGHRDAPMMAERVKDRKVHIDAFVSSTANRAITTAGYFAKAWDVSKKDIIQVKKLYHAMPSVFLEVIRELDDQIKTAALFSHNPGITAFVNQLGVAQLDDMPTCAVFAIKADTKHWMDFADAPKEFWFFDYPKS
jgi:phosphohistidine phosphatase